MSGVRFWCYNAGHVLGAAMFMIEIAGVKLLYTGDFSCEEDRHLMAAEVPAITPDILISVSTVKPGSQYDAGAYVTASVASSLVHNITLELT